MKSQVQNTNFPQWCMWYGKWFGPVLTHKVQDSVNKIVWCIMSKITN